jgi:hypothetical protein
MYSSSGPESQKVTETQLKIGDSQVVDACSCIQCRKQKKGMIWHTTTFLSGETVSDRFFLREARGNMRDCFYCSRLQLKPCKTSNPEPLWISLRLSGFFWREGIFNTGPSRRDGVRTDTQLEALRILDNIAQNIVPLNPIYPTARTRRPTREGKGPGQ